MTETMVYAVLVFLGAHGEPLALTTNPPLVPVLACHQALAKEALAQSFDTSHNIGACMSPKQWFDLQMALAARAVKAAAAQ